VKQTQHHTNLHTRDSLRDATCQWHARAAASRAGIVAMLGTTVTAKIRPNGAPGGNPNKGEP
jgi:hypothetical protein